LYVNGKCTDQFSMRYEHKGKSMHGAVPVGIGLEDENYGDYMEFTYCLDCGQIQGDFPIPEDQVLEAFEDEEADYWREDDEEEDEDEEG